MLISVINVEELKIITPYTFDYPESLDELNLHRS